MKMRRTSTVSAQGSPGKTREAAGYAGHVRLPIPLDVARELGLKPGDVMLWTLDGTIMTLERADG